MNTKYATRIHEVQCAIMRRRIEDLKKELGIEVSLEPNNVSLTEGEECIVFHLNNPIFSDQMEKKLPYLQTGKVEPGYYAMPLTTLMRGTENVRLMKHNISYHHFEHKNDEEICIVVKISEDEQELIEKAGYQTKEEGKRYKKYSISIDEALNRQEEEC